MFILVRGASVRNMGLDSRFDQDIEVCQGEAVRAIFGAQPRTTNARGAAKTGLTLVSAMAYV